MILRMLKGSTALFSACLVVFGLASAKAEADEAYVLSYLVSSGWYSSPGQSLVQCTSSETVAACEARALEQVSTQASASSWFATQATAVSFIRFVDAPAATKDLFRDKIYTYTNASGVQQALWAAQVSSTAKSRKEAVQDSSSGDSAGNNLTCPAGGCPNPVTGVSASAIRGVDVPQPLQPGRIQQSAPYVPSR